MRYLPVFVLIAAAAVGGTWYALQSVDQAPPAPPAGGAETPPAAPEQGSKPPVAAALERRQAPAPAARTEGFIEYPDGTFYPPLNGVKNAPKLVFHPLMAPFAKVVGIERDARGRDWYVHENGVRSTVYINSAGVATYEIEKPMAIMPVIDETGGVPGEPKK
jgi:hypothetical protein